MNIKKLSIATLVGAVVFYLAGFLIWGIALDGLQNDHLTHYEGLGKEMPDMLPMILSMVCTALLYAIIYEKWAGIRTFMTGAKAGALIALLVGLGHSLLMMSMMNLIDWTIVFSDVVGNLVWGALGGGVIGWMLGKIE